MTKDEIQAAFKAASVETLGLLGAVERSLFVTTIAEKLTGNPARFMGAGSLCTTREEAERIQREIEPLLAGIYSFAPDFGGTFTVAVIPHGEAAYEIRVMHVP